MKTSIAFRSLAVGLFLALPFTSVAQESTPAVKASSFGVGDQTVAIGFGLGIRYGFPDNTAIAPAIALIYDVGVTDELGPGTFSLGGIVGFKSARHERRDWVNGVDVDYRWRNLLVGARGAYHFALGEGFENLDLYGGIMGGFRFQSFRNRTHFILPDSRWGYDRRDVRPIIGFFGGARYNFTPQIGAWLEVGYDVSLIKAGIHVNL